MGEVAPSTALADALAVAVATLSDTVGRAGYNTDILIYILIWKLRTHFDVINYITLPT